MLIAAIFFLFVPALFILAHKYDIDPFDIKSQHIKKNLPKLYRDRDEFKIIASKPFLKIQEKRKAEYLKLQKLKQEEENKLKQVQEEKNEMKNKINEFEIKIKELEMEIEELEMINSERRMNNAVQIYCGLTGACPGAYYENRKKALGLK